MMQRLTSKRLGRQAYFRSLLMLGLVAGGSCAPWTNLSAQSPSGLGLAEPPRLAESPRLAELPSAPPSLPEIHATLSALPLAPAKLPARLSSAGSRQAIVHAPRHVVHLLGLKLRSSDTVSRSMSLAVPSQFDVPQLPELKQVQFESSPRTSSGAADGGVTHAYLAESNTPALQGPGHAPVRPLSSAPLESEQTAPEGRPTDVSLVEHTASDQPATSASKTGGSAHDDAPPVMSGPVRFDAAFPGAAPQAATATPVPVEESESLLDLDLSALTVQRPLPVAQSLAKGPRAAAEQPARSVHAPVATSIIEETPPKLIATEQGSLSDTQPIVRAPQLALPDAFPAEEPSKSAPVRAHLAAAIVKPTRVKIHETFAPGPASAGESFHMSDAEIAKNKETASALEPSAELKLADPYQPVEALPDLSELPQEQKLVENRQLPEAPRTFEVRKLPATQNLPEELTLAEAPKPAGEHKPVAQPMPTETQPPALVSAPALLPLAPTMSGVPKPTGASTSATTDSALAVPFVPGTEGLVVKASRPGLELREPHKLDAKQLDAKQGESRTAEIAGSSAHRPISLRIGAEAMAASPASSPVPERHDVSERNPIAMNGPVVRAVKQMAPEPVTQPAAATEPIAQPTDALETSKHSQLVQDLMTAIKKTFPSSRVELKADEEDEGLVAEGVAASESEAKKILAMVRKTALCPVADRIITKR